MITAIRATVLSAPVLVGVSAHAQDLPDPIDVLRRADRAIAACEYVRFDAQITIAGGLTAFHSPARARVIARRFDDTAGVGWKFSIQSTSLADEPVRTALAYDGRSLRFRDDTNHAFSQQDPDAVPEGLLVHGRAAAPLLRWNDLVGEPLLRMESPLACRTLGTVTVVGVPCDLVYVDLADLGSVDEYGAWWYIAHTDHLPRRLDLLHYYVDGQADDGADGIEVIELANLSTDPATEPAAADGPFSFPRPDGYTDLSAQSRSRRGRPADSPLLGEPAPDFTLSTPDGAEVHLADLRGSVVVLDFWATWCGPCRAVMPHMQELHTRYADRGVRVYGLNCWETGDPAAFMKAQGYTYPILLGADEVAASYRVEGIPTFVVIDRTGRVVFAASGSNRAPEVAQAVERALRDAPDGPP